MRHLLINNTAVADDASVSYQGPEFLPKAQIGIFDVASGSNLNLTGANATDKMIIAQGVASGKTPVKTHILELDRIKKVVQTNYSAPEKQITYVGYDGSTGDIDDGAGDYNLKVTDVTNGYQPEPTYNANYFTKEAAISYKIASEIAKVATKNRRFFVQVDVVTALATTQLQDAGPANATAAAVHGSDQVVVSDDASELTAGDYLRIGSATDTSFPVYMVKSISGNVVTLDRPYAGDTASALALGSTSTAPSSSDAAGLKLTGATPAPDNDEGIAIDLDDQVTAFNTGLSEDFGDTPRTSAQTPKPGTGSYLQIRSTERNTQASEGFFYRMTPFQADKPEFFADSNLNYDVVTIQYKTNTTPNIAKSNTYVEIVLAFQAGVLDTEAVDFNTFFGV
jgi:hypothetical protein